MPLKLNEQGLPEPGRELDAWLWEHVFHNVVLRDDDGRIVGFVDLVASPEAGEIYREVLLSTSAACFQVMEAKRDKWAFEFEQMRGHDSDLCVVLKDTNEEAGSVALIDTWVSTKDRTLEAAYAHAVCACVWKAEGGEG